MKEIASEKPKLFHKSNAGISDGNTVKATKKTIKKLKSKKTDNTLRKQDKQKFNTSLNESQACEPPKKKRKIEKNSNAKPIKNERNDSDNEESSESTFYG